MLTEEECMACLNQFMEDTNYYVGYVICNNHNYEFDVLSKLIKEHFELVEEYKSCRQEIEVYYELLYPDPYKLEELKPNMYVWDDFYKDIFLIYDVHGDIIKVIVTDRQIGFKKVVTLGTFQENRFFPITKANQ